MYNNDLTANNKKFQASYSNGKYGFMIDNTFYEIGGANMKCAKFGTVFPTSAGVVVDISDLNLTSSEDYMIICDGTGYSVGAAINDTLWIESKTATSFTIKCQGQGPSQGSLVSYQVITFK